MASGDSSRYVHGTHPDEQARLSLLNDLLNASSLRELALRGGERILDVGAGLGQLARAMASAAGPGGRVVGIERSPEHRERAAALARQAGEEGLAELRAGEAADLPLTPEEWGGFDVAHARFLLEHVPDPLVVVRGMVRAVKPGGRVVLEDDDHDLLRLWPEPRGVMAVWRAYARAYERNGNDPIVGRRLVSLLHQAGAAPSRCTWIFFGSCAGEPDFPAYVENLAGVLEGAAAEIEAAGLAPGALGTAMAELRGWALRPDAAFWFARCWAEGRPSGA